LDCSEKVVCSSDNQDANQFPSCQVGTTCEGSCAAGYYGSPTRYCRFNANNNQVSWDAIQSPCERYYCSEEQLLFATWAKTASGENANGACIDGYKGTIQRKCNLNGVWDSSSVVGICKKILIPVKNVHLVKSTSTSLEIAWTNQQESFNDIKISFHNSSSFYDIINGNDLPGSSLIINDLSPKTKYDIRIIPSVTSETIAKSFTQVTFSTTIPPLGKITIESYSTYALVKWENSDAEWHKIQWYLLSAKRAKTLVGEKKVLATDNDSGNFTITGLEPSSAYTIEVYSGVGEESNELNDQSGVTSSFQTKEKIGK
jgi:hypothetical protein